MRLLLQISRSQILPATYTIFMVHQKISVPCCPGSHLVGKLLIFGNSSACTFPEEPSLFIISPSKWSRIFEGSIGNISTFIAAKSIYLLKNLVLKSREHTHYLLLYSIGCMANLSLVQLIIQHQVPNSYKESTGKNRLRAAYGMKYILTETSVQSKCHLHLTCLKLPSPSYFPFTILPFNHLNKTVIFCMNSPSYFSSYILHEWKYTNHLPLCDTKLNPIFMSVLW